jgi:hypothetical protein
MKNSAHGFTLLELLVTSSLSLSLLFCSILLLFDLEQAQLQTHQHFIADNKLKRGQALFTNALRASEEHRIPKTVQALSADFFSQLHNPPRNSEYQPIQNSDLLYSVELESLHRFSLLNKQQGFDVETLRAQACRTTPSKIQKLSPLALALSPNSIFCVRLSLDRYPLRCQHVEIRRVPCVYFPDKKTQPIFGSTLLIPIRREYLLYVTQSAQLRYLGLEGLFVKENQPVATGMRRLRLRSSTALSPRFESFTAQLETRSGESLSITHEQRVSRLHPLEILFHEADLLSTSE